MKVILAHGVLGFGTIDLLRQHVRYFKGVAEDLTTLGVKVEAPSVGPTDPISERAAKLAAAINSFFSPADPGHVIAHSMGGLDAQYALAQLDGVAERVKSLVTIGTPYFGSPIADLLSASHALHAAVGIEPAVLRELESSVALHDLGTEAGAEFTAKNPDQNGVRYHHIAGVGRPISILPPSFHSCAAFAGTSAIMAAHRLVNDGIVPINSACRGLQPWETWQVDHADEVGWDLDNPLAPASEEHLARYRRIIRRLSDEQ